MRVDFDAALSVSSSCAPVSFFDAIAPPSSGYESGAITSVSEYAATSPPRIALVPTSIGVVDSIPPESTAAVDDSVLPKSVTAPSPSAARAAEAEAAGAEAEPPSSRGARIFLANPLLVFVCVIAVKSIVYDPHLLLSVVVPRGPAANAAASADASVAA